MSSNLIYASTKVLPYVYRLTHKVTGQFYIGVRSANRVPSSEDIGKYYFSSSKVVCKLGFENFHIDIVAEFFDASAAIILETALIIENWTSPLKLNLNISGSKFSNLWEDPEHRQKMMLVQKDPGYRDKIAKACKATWQDLGYQQKVSCSLKKTFSDPEHKIKMSAIRTKTALDPAYRDKMSKALKAKWEDHDLKKKASEKTRLCGLILLIKRKCLRMEKLDGQIQNLESVSWLNEHSQKLINC